MIVVDTDIIAYLLIQGLHTDAAEELFHSDPEWIAPILWRSEFRNLLALYSRQKYLTFERARSLIWEAESLMRGNELEVDSSEVLNLCENSKCSAYDCEFVALAKKLHLKLFTSDTMILNEFPQIAHSLKISRRKN